jgi:hypothetical protein
MTHTAKRSTPDGDDCEAGLCQYSRSQTFGSLYAQAKTKEQCAVELFALIRNIGKILYYGLK